MDTQSAAVFDNKAKSATTGIPTDGRLWNVTTVAQYLDTPEATIRCWIFNRKIPFLRVGRRVKFRKYEIDEWLERNRSACRS